MYAYNFFNSCICEYLNTQNQLSQLTVPQIANQYTNIEDYASVHAKIKKKHNNYLYGLNKKLNI